MKMIVMMKMMIKCFDDDGDVDARVIGHMVPLTMHAE